MEDLNNFIDKFSGLTESYWFYSHTLELRYDVKNHVYLLVTPHGTLERVNGVTETCHIIDKSVALLPWGCKMMAQKLLDNLPIVQSDGTYKFTKEEINKWVSESKTAHKEKLKEAGDVGNLAHAWIESYIKAIIAKDKELQEQLLQNFPPDERSKNACIAAIKWMGSHNVRWICTERKIYSKEHRYAGTMDGLALVDSCHDTTCCPHPFKNRLSVIDWKTSNFLWPEYLMQTASYEKAFEEETGENVEDRWIIRLGKDDAKFETWHLEEDNFTQDFNAFLAALNLRRQFDELEERLTNIKDTFRAKKKQEKQDSLSIQCKKFAKYKGIRPPKCNNGTPCEACLNKYNEIHKDKKKVTKKTKPSPAEIVKSLQSLVENT